MSVRVLHTQVGGGLLAVVIPTRGVEPWRIRNALSSIRQSVVPVEIIVSDYGSTKNETYWLLEYAGRFDATLLHVETDSAWNISVAYNTGIRRCKSPVIVTVDADIIYSPETFENTLSLVNGNNIVIRQPIFIDANIPLEDLRFPESYALLESQPKRYVSPSVGCFCAMTRENWFRLRGFEERFRMYGSEDWELWKRVGKNRINKVLIGASKFNYPHLPPEPNTLIYHQHHESPDKRLHVSEAELEAHRERNRTIYEEATEINHNREDWGLQPFPVVNHPVTY